MWLTTRMQPSRSACYPHHTYSARHCAEDRSLQVALQGCRCRDPACRPRPWYEQHTVAKSPALAPAAPQCRPLHAWLLADRAELEGSNRPLQVPKSAAGKVALLLFEGGTKWDAFLIAASAQVVHSKACRCQQTSSTTQNSVQASGKLLAYLLTPDLCPICRLARS